MRQLQNIVRNVVVLNSGKLVTPDMLPALEDGAAPPARAPVRAAVVEPVTPAPMPATALPLSEDAIQPLAAMERRYIENAIAICGGNLQDAARRLGISPSTIYRKKEGWAKGG